MANLHVSYADMQQEASSLRSGKEQITQDLNGLRSRIDGLVQNGFVTDSASGAFQTMYHNFTTSANNTIAALDQIASTLDQMANTLQQVDHDLGSKVQG